MTFHQRFVRLYRKLVSSLPAEFRAEYGEEMAYAAEESLRDAGDQRSWKQILYVAPGLLADVLSRIVAEHVREIAQDTRYAARILARSPAFTLAAVVCLSIGIGGSAGMYAQLRSTIFQDVPGVSNPQSLVRLQGSVSFGMFQNLQESTLPFAEVVAYHGPAPLLVANAGAPSERVWCHVVSPNYFQVLGVGAIYGRVFGEEERVAGGAPVIVLSERLWKSRFGADPRIVGRVLRVNGRTATVIGVAESNFQGLSPSTAAADAWLPSSAPLSLAPELQWLSNRRVQSFHVVGRLQPSVSIDQAEKLLEARVRRLEQVHNDPGKERQENRVALLPGGRLYPVRDRDLPRVIGFPFVLVTLVLLMACANVANMLLARGAARRNEIALRLSLGANRGRIVRQMLTENLLLALLGWAGGVVYAIGFLRTLESVKPMLPAYVRYEAVIDWNSLLFAGGVAALSGILFGMAPAIRASAEQIYAGLKRNAPTFLGRSRRFGLSNILVFQQVTVSMVLLLLTGIIVIGWQRSAAVETGFEPANLFLVHMDPIRDGYTPEQSAAFFEKLPEQLRSIVGVSSASVVQSLPSAMSGGDAIVSAKNDYTAGTTSSSLIRTDRVGEGFFETAGISILRGRAFRKEDERDNARIVIVNERLANEVAKGGDPIGKTIELNEQQWEIVGVAEEIRAALPLSTSQLEAYLPNVPSGFAAPAMRGVTIAVRSHAGRELGTILRNAMERIDPKLTVVEVRRMTDEIEQMYFLARFSTYIYGGMGLFGLILAAVGLAGVTAYSVARRTHEIGIRMAMGAQSGQILWLVMREGGSIVIAGTIAGLAAALLLTRALSAALEALAETTRTSVSDPLVVVGGPLLLASIALAACYFPARRSTRINPVAALRSE